ncbi:MAG: hypothetical protein FRX48_02531 [Lasallia pustulata]|uniref:MYND-type domain-containing protein n=1 Tax=Lasallia pustulata TaxID=136370 RepID=A0A5M8PYQ0_9LECA|nr:MAG: hypothetical protein FRX48_02531 [Lasallia pustulata]
MAFPKDDDLQHPRAAIPATHRGTQLQRDPSWDESTFDPKTFLPDQGSPAHLQLQYANSAFSPPPTSPPGKPFLSESSILTANNRHLHPLCDACSSELPPISSSQDLHACPSCPETVFCSATCATLSHRYHPAICGKDVDAIGNDPPPGDAANALYLLLLGRTIALAKTQSTHPLDLPETKYLWGDFIRPTAPTCTPTPTPLALALLPPLHRPPPALQFRLQHPAPAAPAREHGYRHIRPVRAGPLRYLGAEYPVR